MNVSLAFLRVLFFILCVFFMTTFMVSSPRGAYHINALIGIGMGCLLALLLFAFDTVFRRFNLRSFNIGIIGLFIGYLMGQALVLVFDAVLDISKVSIVLQPQVLEMIKISLFLFGTYLGTIMTLKASDELYVSIPFIKFAPTAQKKKDLILDSSVLSDARIIDLSATGMLDHLLIIPRFLIKEIYSLSFFCTSTSQPQPHLLCRLTCSFFLSETPLFKKKNKRLLRHGRSKPNEAGLIVSSLKNGTKREHGLSATGREQAKEAG